MFGNKKSTKDSAKTNNETTDAVITKQATGLMLPDEIWVMIFSMLSQRDLANIELVNMYFHNVRKMLPPLSEVSKYWIDTLKTSRQQNTSSFWQNSRHKKLPPVNITQKLFDFIGNPNNLLALMSKDPVQEIFIAAYKELEKIVCDWNKEGEKQEQLSENLLHTLIFCGFALQAMDYVVVEKTKTALIDFAEKVTSLINKLSVDTKLSSDKRFKLTVEIFKGISNGDQLIEIAKKSIQLENRDILPLFLLVHGSKGILTLLSDEVLDEVLKDQNLKPKSFSSHILVKCIQYGTPQLLHACLTEISKKFNYKDVVESFYKSLNHHIQGIGAIFNSEVLSLFQVYEPINEDISSLLDITATIRNYNALTKIKYLFSLNFVEHEEFSMIQPEACLETALTKFELRTDLNISVENLFSIIESSREKIKFEIGKSSIKNVLFANIFVCISNELGENKLTEHKLQDYFSRKNISNDVKTDFFLWLHHADNYDDEPVTQTQLQCRK